MSKGIEKMTSSVTIKDVNHLSPGLRESQEEKYQEPSYRPMPWWRPGQVSGDFPRPKTTAGRRYPVIGECEGCPENCQKVEDDNPDKWVTKKWVRGWKKRAPLRTGRNVNRHHDNWLVKWKGKRQEAMQEQDEGGHQVPRFSDWLLHHVGWCPHGWASPLSSYLAFLYVSFHHNEQ